MGMTINGTREKVLAVAEEMLYQGGYTQTSIEDIIVRARVSKSNFYYHFRSKEELGMAVLRATLNDDALPPRERLARFLEQVIRAQEETLQKGGCPFGNLVVEMSERSERFRCRLSSMFNALVDRLAEVIRLGQQEGVFREDVPARDLGALVLHTLQGMQLITKCEKCVDGSRRSARVLRILLERV
jgi:TetR/AcrR family transcriptional repressor of nem operon